MPLGNYSGPPLQLQRIRQRQDLKRITFKAGWASVEVPWNVARTIRFKNDQRSSSPRLDMLTKAIRRDGFQPFDPIIVRIGRKGRWVVMDGGHRLTAARKVDGEWWTNLFGRRVGNLYFLVYVTERSWAGRRKSVRRRRKQALLA